MIGSVLAITVGSLLPLPDVMTMRPGRTMDAGLSMPWNVVGHGGIGWLELAYPLLLAVLALLTLKLHGAIRGIALLFGTLAMQVVGVLITVGGAGSTVLDKSFRGDGASIGILIVLVIFCGLTGVAVGNHVRKRAPASGAASTLSGVGGLLLLLLFLMPIAGTPLFRVFFEGEAWRAAWSMMLLLLLILGFAVLGLRAFSSEGIAGRCFLTSLVARLLLFGYPIAMAVLLASQFSFGVALALCLRMGLLFAGPFCLLTTGLAAWIEGAIVARAPARLDPKTTGEIFG